MAAARRLLPRWAVSLRPVSGAGGTMIGDRGARGSADALPLSPGQRRGGGRSLSEACEGGGGGAAGRAPEREGTDGPGLPAPHGRLSLTKHPERAGVPHRQGLFFF